MSPELQQAYWRSTGEPFEIQRSHLAFTEHKMSEYGNCQRCGYHPKQEPSTKD